MDPAFERLLLSEAEYALDRLKANDGPDPWIYLTNGRQWRRVNYPSVELVAKAITALRKRDRTSADQEDVPIWYRALQAAEAYLSLLSVIQFYHQRETGYGVSLRGVIGTTLMKAFPEMEPEHRDRIANVLAELLAA